MFPLHLFVGEARKRRAKCLNVEIVWSVFGAEEFSTSARLFYRTLRELKRSTRLWGPPVGELFAYHMWGPEAELAALAIKAAFVGGEKCPHDIENIRDQCLGNPGRDARIYGAYKKTVFGIRVASALPVLLVSVGSVSASPQPAVREDCHSPAVGEDLAVTHRLPEEYYGVTVQRDPGRKTLTLKAEFMDASFEPVSSSKPSLENLAKCWQAVSKSIRDSFDHKAIPEDLKAAMKNRAKLYLSAVGEASDVVDLAVGASVVGGLAPESPAFVDFAAEAPDVGLPPAKRPCRSVSRSHGIATSSSSSSQVEPDAGRGRSVLSGPSLVGGEVAFPRRVLSVLSAGFQQRSWGF